MTVESVATLMMKAWMAGSSPAMTRGKSEPALLRHPLLQPRLHDPVARQLIRAFVLGMTGVALDPVPVDFMRLQRRVEALL